MSYRLVGDHDTVEDIKDGPETIPPGFAREKARHRYFSHPHSLHTAISVAAGAIMCLFGYEQGVFGGIIVGRGFLDYFERPSAAMQGFVTSVYDLGCFAGALLTLLVGERLGRKRVLVVFTVIMAVGIVMQTAARSMGQLVWGRFVAGLGNGGNSATAPVWHVETSHHSAKGKAIVKEMTVNVLGFVISNVVTLLLSGNGTTAQWRFPLGIQLVFVLVILCLVPVLPESPRWLLARGRDAEAREVLARLSEDDVEAEFVEIRDAVRLERAARASWKRVFDGGQVTRRLLLGMMLQVAQQLSGINVLCYYLPLVLHRSVGLPELTARLVSTANAVSYMLATAASMLVIERMGRRPLLMSMAGGMSVAFLGIAVSVAVGENPTGGDNSNTINTINENNNLAPGIMATAFIWLYFTTFSFGWIAVPWLYPAEINSLGMRTKGAALATACDWLFNYLVVQTTPVGIQRLHWLLYLVYALLNLSFVPAVYYLVVETRGRSLEQIDRWFLANPAWLVHRADHSP
ncbi:hypothetical protein LTR66_015880, partial [Elasticomyces elasticus]